MKIIKFLLLGLIILIVIGAWFKYQAEYKKQNSNFPLATPTTNIIATSTKLSDSELLQKIDQIFIVGFRGFTYDSSPELKRAISETNLGGVILFDYDVPSKKYLRNIRSESELKKLISDSQTNAKTPLFVSIDEEGGRVSRLKNLSSFEKTPSAKDLGFLSNQEVKNIASHLGAELNFFGFNIDFAPVLDVNVNSKNPIIGSLDRSFSNDPSVVAEKGIGFFKGLEEKKIISVGKHFPGHGSSLTDSHLGFVDITDTYQDSELIPFKKACEQNIPAIMMAHLFNKKVDLVYPASLSAKFVNLLRDSGCTNQLIISDDLDMGAISKEYSKKLALTQAINAGIDIIIISNNVDKYNPNEFFDARKMVFDQVKSGKISEDRINQSFQKILSLKKQYGIMK